MRTIFSNILIKSVILILLSTCMQKGIAQETAIIIDDLFRESNLKNKGKIYSNNAELSAASAYDSLIYRSALNSRDFFYFDFKAKYNYILFDLQNNEDNTKELILQFNNALLQEVLIFKKEGQTFNLINHTGIEHPFESRLVHHRNFLVPIPLSKNERGTFLVRIKTDAGKPLVTGVKLLSKSAFKKKDFGQYLLIGSYFGLSILSIVISLFAFYYLKNTSYLIYAFYVIFLSLFIGSYVGVLAQFAFDGYRTFNKFYYYVLFSEISLLLFVVFSQRVLNAKENAPKLKRVADILVLSMILIRFGLHFVFPSLFDSLTKIFMLIWYSIFIVAILVVVVEIFIYYKKNSTRTSLFALAYIFMLIGAFCTVLYHSFGLIDTFIFGLPIIFYSSILEILFLTFTVIVMVKEIYDDRNILAGQLAHQQQKFLTAFIDGQEKERERIGKELHDNVGSKLGSFKRLFERNYSNDPMTDEIDAICDDVRTLSHQIAPTEIKLVGLPGAISDLITKYSDEGLTIEFNCYEFPENLNERISSNLYRIVQESLTNVIKHAEASLVDVQLIGHKEHLTLSIEDDGKGFNNTQPLKGIGLQNIKSRIEQLKGNFLLNTAINQGTSILVTIPIS